MASRSPSGDRPAAGQGGDEYLQGWAALTRLMLDGNSWSGHERNCAYLNLGDSQFADASFAAGFDFEDDGRAVAAVDWDGDGDLDLWLKNRTGPQLRFLRNRAGESGAEARSVMLRLQGKSANRDGVGARVELFVGDRRLRRDVVSGDGYLAQSTRWLHFGLGAGDAKVDRLVVHWPGGAAETIAGVAAGGRYLIGQGSGQAVSVPGPQRAATPPEATQQSAPFPSRVLLKVPLPLPPSITGPLYRGIPPKKAMLVNLWAQWCEPCFRELGEFADRYDELQAAGLEIEAISVDPAEDLEQAAQRFAERIAPRMEDGARFTSRPVTPQMTESLDAILAHVLHRHGELSLPTSLLIDRRGRIQMIYLGAVPVDTLLEDTRRWALEDTVPAYRRSLYGGRWYFRTPRALTALADTMRARGLGDDAQFYYAVQAMSDRNRRPPSK